LISNTIIIALSIIGALCLLSAAIGVLIGRITKRAVGPLFRFKLSDAQLTLIAYEASRAYRIAHGDISAKSFNNLPRAQRRAMIDRIAEYRRRPSYLGPDASPELQLQAAIVALAV
jgi:hypothetical protein